MFRFYLDSNLQADEDIHWKDAKLGVKRNKTFQALFLTYMTDLTFQGDSYDYIISVFESSGGHCKNVALQVKYCADEILNTWTTIFDGQIMMRNIKHNEYDYQVTCHADDSYLTSEFMKFLDTEYDISTGLSQNSTANTPAPLRKIYMLDKTGNGSADMFGYFVSDALQCLLECMTDNKMSLQSNYLETLATRRYITTIKFTNTTQIVGVGVFTISWTDYCNVVHTVTCTKQATAAQSLDECLYELRQKYKADEIEDYYFNDYKFPAKVTHDGVDTLTLEWDLEITNPAVGGASSVHAVTQTMTDGMKKLVITNGAWLKSVRSSAPAIPPIKISFKDLFEELTKHMCLGMRISRVGTGSICSIEPISTFFASTSQITLSEVPKLGFEISDDYAKDKIMVGEGKDKRQSAYTAQLTDKDEWSATGTCNSAKLDANNKYVTDFQDIQNQCYSLVDNNNDKLYLIEAKDTFHGGYDAEVVPYDELEYSNNTGTFIKCNVINAHLTNYWKIRRNLFIMIGDPEFAGKVITNDASPRLLKNYTFEYPLSYSEILTMLQNTSDYITFRATANTQDNRLGWIDSVEMTLDSGMTNFTLITI